MKDLKSQVEPIIKQAGEILLSYFSRAKHLDRRTKNGAGFFTEADIASETFLIEELSKIMPDASFYAEESGVSGSSRFCWVIDPLDGTTNFAHGLPHFCISVALTDNDEPILGMIYNPVLKELFWAQKGGGAWLARRGPRKPSVETGVDGDDQKIQVTSPAAFDQSLLVVGFPYKGLDGEYVKFMEYVTEIGPKAYSFRQFGAAALDLAYVACGRFDGIMCSRMAWWDFAAGSLLVTESGGQITDFEGRLLGKSSESFAAGSKLVHEQLLRFLAK